MSKAGIKGRCLTCKIDIPEKVPLTWDFQHEIVIGFAEVTKDKR